MYRKWMIGLLLFVTVLFAISGCSQSLPYNAERDMFYMNDTAISEGAVRILFYAMEKQENDAYQELYGRDFWDKQLFSDSDMTYAQYQKEHVFYEEFLNMAALDFVWKEQNELTEQEVAQIEKTAKEYYDSLSEKDIEYLKISTQDVTELFRMYYCAMLEKESLEAQVNTEVSEEEARVMTVLTAVFEKREDAGRFLEEVSTDGNFEDLAAEHPVSEVRTEYLSKESEYSENLLNVLFSAKEGDSLGVFSEQGEFLVLLLQESYNEERSDIRREGIIQERLNAGWRKTCEQYLKSAEILISKPLWEELNFSDNAEFQNDGVYRYLNELTADLQREEK